MTHGYPPNSHRRWKLLAATLVALNLRLGVCRSLQEEFVAALAAAPDQLKLPDDHPPKTKEHTTGLPKSCITYKEKYEKYQNLSARATELEPNEIDPYSRYVIVIRMHFGIAWRRDLVLHLRSLMKEASQAGLHLYLLFEVSSRPDAAPDDTPEKFRHSVPSEFRSIAFYFDEFDVHNAYQQLHRYKLHMREYLPLVWFLHRFPGYKFAWYIEYDVRYTGRSVGDFLNAALQKAIATADDSNLGKAEGDGGDAPISGGAPLPPADARIPDLLLIGDGVHTTSIDDDSKPRDYEPRHWNFTQLHHRQVQVMGVSRKLADTLHRYSIDGRGGFIEEFIPSLAVETNMTVVSIPIAEFGNRTFHCCFKYAETFYQDWFTSGNCRQAALLHPVKLEDRVWKEQDVRAASEDPTASS